MRKPLLLLALLSGLSLTSWAQTTAPVYPVEQLANTVPVGAEGITVTACTPTCTLQIGIGAAWSIPIANPTLPLTLSYAGDSIPAVLGADPAVRVAKSVVAQQGDIAYTVTFTDAAGNVHPPVTVPALIASPSIAAVACAIPPRDTTVVQPVVSPNCALLPNAVAIATDGQMAGVTVQTAPVYLQYCQGAGAVAKCGRPFNYVVQPILVGPKYPLGNPGGTGVGTLYVIPGQVGVTVSVSPGPVTTTVVPSISTAATVSQ
ncbi:MAG: hypothetical protein H0U76_08545 [Ktedonobacteraceae bacterium]|nr:hypothetical protein [Ktedonobacteraceae bacterium]